VGPERRRRYNGERRAKQRESRQFLERMRGPDDLPGIIELHRHILAADPDALGTRFMLANCLYVSGEHTQAEADWQMVYRAGGTWAEMVTETRQMLRQIQDEGTD
jgi:cytochrome c-type biogenesis protein CcmH/NrfG